MHRKQNYPGSDCQRLKDIRITRTYINKIIKKLNEVVNNTFVKMIETLSSSFDRNGYARSLIDRKHMCYPNCHKMTSVFSS